MSDAQIPDLPDWAWDEQAFAEWCSNRGLDEDDEAWERYETWLDARRDD